MTHKEMHAAGVVQGARNRCAAPRCFSKPCGGDTWVAHKNASTASRALEELTGQRFPVSSVRAAVAGKLLHYNGYEFSFALESDAQRSVRVKETRMAYLRGRRVARDAQR